MKSTTRWEPSRASTRHANRFSTPPRVRFTSVIEGSAAAAGATGANRTRPYRLVVFGIVGASSGFTGST